MAKHLPEGNGVKHKPHSRALKRNIPVTGGKAGRKTEKELAASVSLREFLDLLKISYQVTQVTDGLPETLRQKTDIDWDSLTGNDLVTRFLKDPEMDGEDQDRGEGTNIEHTPGKAQIVAHKMDDLHHVVKCKLNDVLHEGLLDSILPYMVPKQASSVVPKGASGDNKPSPAGRRVKKDLSGNSRERSAASKKSSSHDSLKSSSKSDIEVEIHVCDEVRNVKRNFRCPQQLLISRMGYFAEVTSGQKLEDMDISVHCDINIFDWLMRWVKKDTAPEDDCPTLDSTNVIPLLVSAAFLKMEPLLDDCLRFCHANMNDVLKVSTNLSCLTDTILTRLAALYSNTDIDLLMDKRDRIQTKLFSKFIVSLCGPNPEPERGHYATMASIYRCSVCCKLVTKEDGIFIPCKPQNLRIDTNGNVCSAHIRDSRWNITEYVQFLRQDLKSWRQIYWRLWGECHILHCSECGFSFPCREMKWCCYHSKQAQFFPMDSQPNVSFPIGRYGCCGMRAYRFEPIQEPMSGCEFKQHTVQITCKTKPILEILNANEALICSEPPPREIPDQRIIRLVNSKGNMEVEGAQSRDDFWWNDLQVIPLNRRKSLIVKPWDQKRKSDTQLKPFSALTSEVKTVFKSIKKEPSVETVQSDSSLCSGEESEENSGDSSTIVTVTPRRRIIRSTRNTRWTNQHNWTSKLSIRCNQDNQREQEERVMRQISSYLTRRTCGEIPLQFTRNKFHPLNQPAGGSFVRLEQEWKEKGTAYKAKKQGR